MKTFSRQPRSLPVLLLAGVLLLGAAQTGGCAASLLPPQAVITASAASGVGTPVTLDGSKSTDPNMLALAYAWSFSALPAGSLATLDGADRAAASFTPDVAGDYEVTLVVTDGVLTSKAATQKITVSSCGGNPPVVSKLAATPAAPATAQLVSLAATVTDADTVAPCKGTEHFTYAWSLVAVPAGSEAALSSATVVSPTFTPDLPGTYTVELTVTDGEGHTSTVSSVDIMAATCGSNPPTAQIAVDAPFGVPAPAAAPPAAAVQAPVGGAVQLDAASSSDADNAASCMLATPQKLTYAWSLEAIPAGSHAVFNDPTAVNASFTPDVPGPYTAKLTVTDDTGRSGAALVVVNGFNATQPVGFGVGPYTSLALDPTTEEPRLAFFDSSGGIKRGVYVATCTGAACATNPIWTISPIDAGIGHHPSIATTASGLAVTYWDNANCVPKYGTSADAGKTWSTSVIQANPQGCQHVTNCSCGGGGGGCNGNPNNNVDGRDQGAFPSLVVSAMGTPAVAFVTYVQGPTQMCNNGAGNYTLAGYDQLTYAVCTGGCTTASPTWSTANVAVGAMSGNARIGYVSMAIDPVSSNPGIAFRSSDNGMGRTAVGYVACTGGCFTAAPTFAPVAWIELDRGFDAYANDSVQTEATTNALAYTSTGHPMVALFDRTNQWLRLSSCTGTCTSASGWSGLVVDASAASVGGFASLALSAAPGALDQPRIAYVNGTGSSLRYAQLGAGGWTLTTLDTGMGASSTSLKLTPTDGARVAYFAQNAVRYYSSGN